MTSRRANTASCARVRAALHCATPSLLLACLLLACLLLPALAAAHQGHRSYCSVRSVAAGIELTVQVPVRQLVEAADGSVATGDVHSVLADGPLWRQELEAHVRATTPEGECELVSSTGPRLEGQAERRAVFELAFTCPRGAVTLGSDYRFDVDRQAEMVCAIDGNAHVFRLGHADRLVGTPPSFVELLLGFVKLGADHVLGGLDHVLFVLALLLGAASAGVSDARRTLGRVVGLVTGFTLGHSVTLIVAALGILALPSRLTESAIALSIVLVGLHNLLAQDPRGRAVTSALFGLVHGFGFASALAETGLPRRGAVPALVAFNVGIELAQLAIVLACFPALVWARQRPWFRSWLLVPACVVSIGLAALWFVKRAFAVSTLPWLGS